MRPRHARKEFNAKRSKTDRSQWEPFQTPGFNSRIREQPLEESRVNPMKVLVKRHVPVAYRFALTVYQLQKTFRRSFRTVYETPGRNIGGFITYQFPFVRILNRELLDVDFDGEYLIATARGFYQIRKRTLVLLFMGHFYGITQNAHSVYVFQRCGMQGRILNLQFDHDLRLKRVRVFLKGLSNDCHQIEIYRQKILHL